MNCSPKRWIYFKTCVYSSLSLLFCQSNSDAVLSPILINQALLLEFLFQNINISLSVLEMKCTWYLHSFPIPFPHFWLLALNPRTLDNLNFFQVSLKVRVIRCELYFKTKWNLSKLEIDKRLSSMLHSNIISGGFFLQSGACEFFNPFLLTFLFCSTLSWWSV